MRTLKFRSYDTIEQAYCPFITDHLKRDLYPHIDVQQWTGLLSKDGVEIFEGDILRIGSSLIEEVKWVGVGDWVGAKQPMVGFISHETIYRKPIEVIGNIYENPELLEATQ